MIKEKIKAAQDWAEDSLRGLFGRLSPERRFLVLIAAFLIFATLSLFITITSIYRMGREDGRMMQIKHIEMLDLDARHTSGEVESTENSINTENERAREDVRERGDRE